MSDYVLLKNLADSMSLDNSNARKYILKHGFEFFTVRDPETKQKNLALTEDEAKQVLELRQSQGFSLNSKENNKDENFGVVQKGFFYVVLVASDLSQSRVKLGYSTEPQGRLATYKTLSPTAEIVKTWNCLPAWEKAAIASITRSECIRVGVEVFDCENLDSLVERADTFFSLMPEKDAC